MTTVIKTGKPLHKENTIDIYNRSNKMIINHYYPYVYNYDSQRDIDIRGDNKEHNILFYYYQYQDDNDQTKYNYDLVNNNFELYFDKINNNNIKISFVNGKIILISNIQNKEPISKKIKFNDDMFCQAKHTIQFGKVKNNVFDIINIDSNLLLDLNELENSLKNGKISDKLINNGLDNDLFTNIYNTYTTNNKNFDYVKEYYGYSFILKSINLHNKNPFIDKNIMFCINLNGEIYINFYEEIEQEQVKEIKIISDIFNKNQDEDNTFKDYYIIPSYEIIYNKYSDLKYINYELKTTN